MNNINLRPLLIASAIFILGTLTSCKDTTVVKDIEDEQEDMELSLIAENHDVIVSGADEGKTFTIKSNIVASENMLIKLVSSSPELCYFLSDEITLPMKGKEVEGKIIFKSKAIEKLGSEANIDVKIECEGVIINPTPLSYKVKYSPKEKPVIEDITVSIESKATGTAQINGEDVPVEIEVSIDKKSTKDITVYLNTSRAVTSRYTLLDDEVTIKAGELTATTSIIFRNTEFIYTSSKADVRVDIDCKTAKISPTSGSITLSAAGTTPITIPSSTMSDDYAKPLTINLYNNVSNPRIDIWNIRDVNEDIVFLFEMIGAEYGTQYIVTTNGFDPFPSIKVIPKDTQGELSDANVSIKFLSNGFTTGTHKLILRATIISGSARFSQNNKVLEVIERQITLTK